VEQALHRTRPFVAVAVVIVLGVGLAISFFGPSGVVIGSGGLDNSGNIAQWHLCRLPPGAHVVPNVMSFRGQEAGCDAPGLDGHVGGHSIRVHVRPGNYLLTEGSPGCFDRAQVTVSPHRFVTPKRFESMSCSIQ
jgi:hypothetical protein